MLSFVFNVNFVSTEYVNMFCFRWLDAYMQHSIEDLMSCEYQSLEIFNWILLLPFCSRLSHPLMIDSWKTTQNKRDHVMLSLKWRGGRPTIVSQGALLFFFRMSWCLLSSTIVVVPTVSLLVLSMLELERGHDRSSLSFTERRLQASRLATADPCFPFGDVLCL